MTEGLIGIIACDVLRLEVENLLSENNRCVFLEQNLHNTPQDLHIRLQQEITRMEESMPEVFSIALCYGLCSKVIEGLITSRCNLVVPRAHDCITLLLGNKDVYAEYVAKYPGTYWYSPGWIATETQPGPDRYEKAYREYCEKFDEDDAQYLMETEQAWMQEYNRACYVDIGIGDSESGKNYTRQCAEWLKWNYDSCTGAPLLMRDLLHGNWDDERFLLLKPGETATQALDNRVIKKVE